MPPRSEVAWIHSVRAYAPGDEHRVEPPDPARARALLGPLKVSERLHRFEIRGFEHVPRVGAGLLVGFHPFYPRLLDRRAGHRELAGDDGAACPRWRSLAGHRAAASESGRRRGEAGGHQQGARTATGVRSLVEGNLETFKVSHGAVLVAHPVVAPHQGSSAVVEARPATPLMQQIAWAVLVPALYSWTSHIPGTEHAFFNGM